MSSIVDFFTGFDYASWVTIIKVVFLSLTVFFILLTFFCLYKIKQLTSHGHGAHGGGHGGSHAPGHAAPEASHDDHAHVETQEHSGIAGHQGAPMKMVSETPVYTETWEQIYKLANSPREAEWKLSIIEADKLADDILQQLGYPGETMGERLMLIKPDQLSTLQDLWDAHKLRNLLVHDINYKVKHEQVLAAINAFERVLRELGAVV